MSKTIMRRIDTYFRLRERGTSIRVEFIAGATTFLTMAYIIFVNPQILALTGMDKCALIAVTAVVTAVATILTGIFANAPIAMAPGMGLNAFFAYSLVLTDKISWQTALGIVFLSGLLFFLLTIFGLRQKLVSAIPRSLIYAVAVGIGFFVTFIGLVNLGLVVKSEATIVMAGPITPTLLVGLAGLLTMLIFEMRRIKGSLIIGIAVSSALAIIFRLSAPPSGLISCAVDIRPLFMKLDIIGALKFSMFSSVFTLMFMDMFDSIGTLVACCHQARLYDHRGEIKGLSRLLGLDAAATMLGAIFGTSTTTAYVESSTGIAEGGRTGLSVVFTGILFLVSVFFLPLISAVPSYATAPALVMVGLFMIKEVVRINFDDLDEAFPSFIIIVTIALSYSISTGLAFGFLSYVFMKLVRGKVFEVKPVMWIIAALSLLYFVM